MKIKLLLFLSIFPFIAFPQNDGDNFFGSDQVHTVNITFSQPNFWDSLLAYYAVDKFMSGNVEIDGTILDSSGVQLKGNSSFNSYPGVKKSMNLDFNEYVAGQDYDGLKKLNLNNGFKDPTMMREKIFLEFCKMIGMPAPRCTYAKVYINGSYWGLYTAVEQVNKSFCEINFGDDHGNLFKGDPHGDLKWKGSPESNYYTEYELKTNEDVNDWSDLVNLIDNINNTPSANFYDSLEKVLDTELYMKYWAADIIFANLDSYTGSGHNYYMYHDTLSDQFKWIMWDCNEAFGNFNQGMSLDKIHGLNMLYIPAPQQDRPLTYFMALNNTYKDAYIDMICYYTENYFNHAVLDPLIDSLADKIRTDYYADPNKMFTNQQFEDNIEMAIYVAGLPGGGDIAGLKSFITTRRDSLQLELEQYGCFLDVPDVIMQKTMITVFPNPSSDFIQINISGIISDYSDYLEICDYTGKIVYRFSFAEKNQKINIGLFNSGLYFLKYDNNYIKFQVIR
ncbi:MAG: CotH kinase family protein [Bacteroidota bacterium]